MNLIVFLLGIMTAILVKNVILLHRQKVILAITKKVKNPSNINDNTYNRRNFVWPIVIYVRVFKVSLKLKFSAPGNMTAMLSQSRRVL